jgi:hypothetical protein
MSDAAKTVTINGKVYALDSLSENARAQVVNLRVTDAEIERLKAQLAIFQTARVTYARALQQELTAMEAGTGRLERDETPPDIRLN